MIWVIPIWVPHLIQYAFYCVITTTIIWLHGLHRMETVSVVAYGMFSGFGNSNENYVYTVPHISRVYGRCNIITAIIKTHMYRNPDHKDNTCIILLPASCRCVGREGSHGQKDFESTIPTFQGASVVSGSMVNRYA